MSNERRPGEGDIFPVSETLNIINGETIYKTDKWWKALVSYYYGESGNTTEFDRAVYLWHNNSGEWKRKQKYLVRSHETWETDRELIEEFLNTESGDEPTYEFDRIQLPVNDFLTVGDAATVFKTAEWWKAVVRIDKKGNYETCEVVVYVWQSVDDEWRRRQKYAIKRKSDWDEEATLISSHLEEFSATTPEPETTRSKEFDPEETKKKLQKDLKRRHIGKAINDRI
jgi:hypothetical protein